MDIMAKAKEAIDILDQIDAYGHTLMPKLSELDCKEQDILHYIEDNKVNMLYCYNIVKKIKDIRVERRKVKNDIELMEKWHTLKSRLSSNENNRQFIMTELHKKEKQLQTTYKNRQYSEEDIRNILKGVTKEKTNDTGEQKVQDKKAS